MQFVAKPVLEDNGQKVGTIRSNENGVTLTVGKENHSFKKLEELKQKMKVSFTGKEVVTKEKEEYEQRLINELADLNVQKMVMTITSVEIDGEVETDLQEIVNWIAGTDVKIFHALKKHIEGNVQRWAPQKKNVQCGNENCKKEHNIMVRLDQSDFFGKG